MEKLLAGYTKFRSDVYPALRQEFKSLASGQEPHTLFLTCADSRIVPDLILQSGPGALFICRNAGNIVPAHGDHNGGVSATIEYAVSALKVRHIVVCGHSDCGVMHALLNPEKAASMPNVANWLGYGARARAVVAAIGADLDGPGKVRMMAQQNVLAQMDNLRTHPCVAAAVAGNKLQLHGWYYDIPGGVIHAYSPVDGKFEPLEEAVASMAGAISDSGTGS